MTTQLEREHAREHAAYLRMCEELECAYERIAALQDAIEVLWAGRGVAVSRARMDSKLGAFDIPHRGPASEMGGEDVDAARSSTALTSTAAD